MVDKTYPYPVALKWDHGPEILNKLKTKIELYFCKKKDSNGGECKIQNFDSSQGYILIHFKSKADQRSVLQRSPHNYLLPDGNRLTLEVFLPQHMDSDSLPGDQIGYGAAESSDDAGLQHSFDECARKEQSTTSDAANSWMENGEQSHVESFTTRKVFRRNSLTRNTSTEEPGENRPAAHPEIFKDVMAILDKEFFTKALKEEIKAEIPSLTIKENPDSVLVSGTFCMIQNLYGLLQGKLKTEKPSDTLENEWRPTDNQADLVCVPSALYEYIMEIYRAEIDNIERRYNVTIGVNSTSEGSTYVRFTSQDRSKSSPEKAKETFTDKVQKVTGDWSQEMVDLSVVPLTLSEIKQQVKDRWSNILVLQEGDKYLILRGPRDELCQVKTFLEKGDYKSARCPVTISSRDLKTEILVDPRHMEILKKLKYREIGEIEQKNDVNIEEQRKNGSILVTFRALNAPPDLSPHASHSFITLLQKTFFNIEKKVISINPDFMDNISILQEDLKMRGVDIVMEYSRGSVVLIGHPINVAFAAEKLTDIQNPGRGQAAAAIEEPMDTNSSTDDKQKTEEADKCPICLCEVEDKVILEKCKHAYCKGCLQTSMAHKPVCAVCGVAYGTIIGNQPDGTMRETTRRSSLPGFVGCDTIVIQYNFQGGVQKENHPNPGKYFSGTSRTTYLPDNKEGRQILSLLKKAFDQRLIFTVGESRTTGAKDTVTWNDIHHKTSMTGGPQNFGYPDPDYLRRVRDELKAKGIE